MTIQPIKTIRKIQPYVPPLEGRRKYGGLLLDFNEKISDDASGNNLYPEYETLDKVIAGYCGVSDDQILVTAGSGAAINFVFRAFCETGDVAVIPAPSFSLFFKAAEVAGVQVKSPAYDKITGEFPLAAVLATRGTPKIVVVCNPNNPTGTLLDLSGIEQIAQRFSDSIVLVDEAYFEYSGVTAVGLIEQYPNIVVLRTFSKGFGLAALRVGYVVANTEIIASLRKVANPYDVAMPSAVAAQQALKSVKAMQAYSREVMGPAKELIENFLIEYAISFYPSKANFICFEPQNAADIFERLANKGIRVRKVIDDNTLRVTIGTVKSAEMFIEAYRAIQEQKKVTKIAFVDRDGTIIFEPPDTFQINRVDQIKLLPGTVAGLQALIADGYSLVMVTNQDGLGGPDYPKANFVNVQNALLAKLAQNGIEFERVFVCPHFAVNDCVCRKPKTGLVDEFVQEYSLDRKRSLMIGDRETDKAFAANLGIQTKIMKTNGRFPVFNTKKGQTNENL